MKRQGAINIKELLKQAIDQNRLKDGLDEVKVKSIWKEITGTYISNATTDIYIHTSKLFVSVNSSIIRSELMLIKGELIKRINNNIGRQFINEIVIR